MNWKQTRLEIGFLTCAWLSWESAQRRSRSEKLNSVSAVRCSSKDGCYELGTHCTVVNMTCISKQICREISCVWGVSFNVTGGKKYFFLFNDRVSKFKFSVLFQINSWNFFSMVGTFISKTCLTLTQQQLFQSEINTVLLTFCSNWNAK